MTKVTGTTLVNAMLEAAAGELADLGVRREGRALVVDGERGDRLTVLADRRAAPAGTASFHTEVQRYLLPFTASNRREPLSAVRGTPYRDGEAFLWDRVLAPNAWPPGIWGVTAETLDTRTAEFVAALRPALVGTWLPLLPRAALHAALRDTSKPLPAHDGGRRIGELMCVIEDATPADRERLADFLEGRGDAELAAWVRIAFDQRL
ncbi:hypothetical protein ABT369_29885 [Dactylosporangium sp. NPDC000244]|uniref:hypothetical protein n=1 Tax=Dactylosporangium sp. NPDC000244 TaxID=3154365 RepID=UPI00331B1277